MKKKHYISIAIISYLLLLLISIPANIIINAVNNTEVIPQGVSGSIWNGKASHISINNKVKLTNTEWSFNFWKIFTGNLAFQINTNYEKQNINGEVGVSIFQRYSVNELVGKISAESITQLANIPLVQLSGLVALDIDHAHWSEGDLPLATGEITWQKAGISIAEVASLGKLTITLKESEQQQLIANITNKGGDISVSGNAELIPENNYSVNINLSATSQASDNIKNSLGLFAKKQQNGSFLLKKTGQLNQLGF